MFLLRSIRSVLLLTAITIFSAGCPALNPDYDPNGGSDTETETTSDQSTSTGIFGSSGSSSEETSLDPDSGTSTTTLGLGTSSTTDAVDETGDPPVDSDSTWIWTFDFCEDGKGGQVSCTELSTWEDDGTVSAPDDIEWMLDPHSNIPLTGADFINQGLGALQPGTDISHPSGLVVREELPDLNLEFFRFEATFAPNNQPSGFFQQTLRILSRVSGSWVDGTDSGFGFFAQGVGYEPTSDGFLPNTFGIFHRSNGVTTIEDSLEFNSLGVDAWEASRYASLRIEVLPSVNPVMTVKFWNANGIEPESPQLSASIPSGVGSFAIELEHILDPNNGIYSPNGRAIFVAILIEEYLNESMAKSPSLQRQAYRNQYQKKVKSLVEAKE